MHKIILLITASPLEQARLRLQKETHEIKQVLRGSQHRELFKLIQQEATQIYNLRQVLLDNKPQIVHFSGHGTGEDGLVFEDQQGKAQLLNTDALAGLFNLFPGQIECVVLNACYSEVQAKAIVKHVGYVIGMNKAIGDRAAIEFSRGFYDALGAGRSVEDAYKFGQNAIQSEGISEHLTPVLMINAEWKPNPPKAAEPLDRVSDRISAETRSNGCGLAQLQKQKKLVEKKILSDQKYGGELVNIEIELYQIIDSNNHISVSVESSISFGIPVIKIQQQDRKYTSVEFGIKCGKLKFKIKNGFMPKKHRKDFVQKDEKWQVTVTGDEDSPLWAFKTYKPDTKVLDGSHTSQYLGLLELLDKNECCKINAYFEIALDIHIEITNSTKRNQKQVTTMERAFFKYIKDNLGNKDNLGDYASKVEINYDPKTIY